MVPSRFQQVALKYISGVFGTSSKTQLHK